MRPENRTILTVDDTPANIRLLTHYLEKQGYRVITAEDGFEGFKAAIQYHPDLVLLDIMMPGTDGYEVCELLKAEEETKDIPVVFLTAKADVEDKIKGFELGAVDYITKPFNLVEIATRVETQLNLKYLQEQNVMYRETLSETRRLTNLGIIGEAVIQHVHHHMNGLQKNLQQMVKKTESDKSNKESQNGIHAALKSVEGIGTTIQKVIELNQQRGLKKDEVDIHSIVQDVLTLLHEESNHSISVEYAKSDQTWSVTGNYYLLQQAIYNLLLGLSKTAQGKKISIEIETSDSIPKKLVKLLKNSQDLAESYVRIDVGHENMNGIVNPEADLFIETENEKGLNLELSATLNIVKEHGGVFYIQNDDKGKKTVASVYLPIVQS